MMEKYLLENQIFAKNITIILVPVFSKPPIK
jgi:hypothetical protein